MSNTQSNSASGTSTVWQIVGRLVAAAIVLAITAFFTPGFSINNIWSLAIAAIVLTIMDYLIVKFTGLHASPFGKRFCRICISCYYFICYSIFCSWIFNFLDGCNYWCFNIWCSRLLYTWKSTNVAQNRTVLFRWRTVLFSIFLIINL